MAILIISESSSVTAVHHGLGRNIDRIEWTIESIESKFAKKFKRPKNREDGSDFDDFWTESIVSTQSIFSKSCERTKNYRIDPIDRLKFRSVDRSIESIDGRLGGQCGRSVQYGPDILSCCMVLRKDQAELTFFSNSI